MKGSFTCGAVAFRFGDSVGCRLGFELGLFVLGFCSNKTSFSDELKTLSLQFKGVTDDDDDDGNDGGGGLDVVQGKCQRRDPPCKYLHPPQHLKEQLLQNGRNNLIMKHLQMQMLAHAVPSVYPIVSALILSFTHSHHHSPRTLISVSSPRSPKKIRKEIFPNLWSGFCNPGAFPDAQQYCQSTDIHSYFLMLDQPFS